MASIRDIAASTGLRGSANFRQAVVPPQQVPVIDNSGPGRNVATSLDAYVAGEYVGQKGRRIQVTQRYTVFVSYDQSSQQRTMEQARQQIVEDFSKKYGQLQITVVHVPDLLTPEPAPQGTPTEDMGFYRGSESWRLRIARASFDIETESEKGKRNTESIKRKYDL